MGLHGCVNYALNPSKEGGSHTFHLDLDLGHDGRWDVCIPVKQFWIIALLGWISITWPLISWALSFSNTVNTMVGNDDI